MPNPSWLKTTANAIKIGETTMKNAAKRVLFDHITGIQTYEEVHVNTLSRYFQKAGIKVFEVGRKGKCTVNPDLISFVCSKSELLQCGVNKMWAHLNKNGVKCSHYEVDSIFTAHIRAPKPIITPKATKIRHRYLVNQVNGAWHGDIHYLIHANETKYLYVLIDDRSRFITGYGILHHKTSAECIKVLEAAFTDTGGKPLLYWADNGLENKSQEMIQFLQSNNIYPVFTMPGNPQSNGKIEKWWLPMEKRLINANSWVEIENRIKIYVNVYNYMLPHSALEKSADSYDSFPVEVFTNKAIQAKTIDSCNITVETFGTIPLKDFINTRQKEPESFQ